MILIVVISLLLTSKQSLIHRLVGDIQVVEQAGSHSESGVKPAIQKCKAGINPFDTLQSVNNRRDLMLNFKLI